jgi:6-phosphogluconolactonase
LTKKKRMKNLFAVLLLFLLVLSLQAQEKNHGNMYTGTFTSEGAEGIYLFSFNNATGTLDLRQVFKGIDNPSFIKISPDKKFLFAVTRPQTAIEASGGFIQSWLIQDNGQLQFINKQVSHGADPCHIDVSADGKYAAIATYGGGTVSLYEIEQDGRLKPAASTIIHEGSGPNLSRQKAPHAHSIKFHPDGKTLFSADLGTDNLNILHLKGNQLKPARQSHVKLAPGAGPRHFSFHPNGKTIYVINELNSTITVVEKKGSKWNTLQSISTLPGDFTGTSYCADIHVSSDGRFVYGSNRGHNSIAVFKTDERTNQLEWITSVSTQGDWPRNFTFSPDGQSLLVANQRSNNITVFRIDENGIPRFTGNEVKVPAPVCLEFQ